MPNINNGDVMYLNETIERASCVVAHGDYMLTI